MNLLISVLSINIYLIIHWHIYVLATVCISGDGNRVSNRDHRPGGFSLDLGLKDMSLVSQVYLIVLKFMIGYIDVYMCMQYMIRKKLYISLHMINWYASISRSIGKLLIKISDKFIENIYINFNFNFKNTCTQCYTYVIIQ